VGYNVIQDQQRFKEIDAIFEQVKDKDGRSMKEVAKEYWEKKRGS